MASSLTRASQNMATGFPDGIPWYWPSQKWVFQNRQKLHGLFRPSLRIHFGNNFTGYKLITESSQDSWKGKVESQIHGWHLASSHCKRAIFAALFGKIQSFTVGTLVTTVHIPPTYKTTLPLPQDPQRLILKVFKVCINSESKILLPSQVLVLVRFLRCLSDVASLVQFPAIWRPVN